MLDDIIPVPDNHILSSKTLYVRLLNGIMSLSTSLYRLRFMEEEIITISAHVSGRVQGVFFKATLAKHAEQLAVDGYVRNLPDGRVYFMAHGPRERLKKLVEWSRKGPPLARVTGIEVKVEQNGEDYQGFQIRR